MMNWNEYDTAEFERLFLETLEDFGSIVKGVSEPPRYNWRGLANRTLHYLARDAAASTSSRVAVSPEVLVTWGRAVEHFVTEVYDHTPPAGWNAPGLFNLTYLRLVNSESRERVRQVIRETVVKPDPPSQGPMALIRIQTNPATGKPQVYAGNDPVAPILCHTGDLYAYYYVGHQANKDHYIRKALAALDEIQQAGYFGLSVWFVMNAIRRSPDYWDPVWADLRSDKDTEIAVSFLRECKKRGLYVDASFADVIGLDNKDEDACINHLADAFFEVDPNLCMVFKPWNEAGAGPWVDIDDRTPEECRRAVNVFRGAGMAPNLTGLSTPGQSEDRDELARWTQWPYRQQFVEIHPYRGGTWADKTRHHYNNGTNFHGIEPVRWLVDTAEPGGPGSLVSSQRNGHELQDLAHAVPCMAAAASLVGWYTYMCSAGVKLAEGPFSKWQGFESCPKVVKEFWPDTMSFATRTHAARHNSVLDPGHSDWRFDHVIDEATGRFIGVAYGQPWSGPRGVGFKRRVNQDKTVVLIVDHDGVVRSRYPGNEGFSLSTHAIIKGELA